MKKKYTLYDRLKTCVGSRVWRRNGWVGFRISTRARRVDTIMLHNCVINTRLIKKKIIWRKKT